MEYRKWSEHQIFIKESSLEIIDQYNNVIYYSYFNTLQWDNCYCIVVNGYIILESTDRLYDEFNVAKDTMIVLDKRGD